VGFSRRLEGQGPGGIIMKSLELAQEFTEIWETLNTTEINAVLANNVSLELLEFFVTYVDQFASDSKVEGPAWDELRQKLPNLLVIGYLIRLLEERVH
jgi:hypothetical protein